MKIINKKEDLKSTIPLMALFVSLNLIITVLSTYIPISGFILTLFLPLISTLFCLNTKKRYFPIYFFISLGLGICVSIKDCTSTLLYLLPSLVQGLFFAIFINLKKDGTLSYFISILILFLTKISIIPLIDFIYGINTIDSILALLGLIKIKNIDLFVNLGMLTICTFEMFIVFIITKNELKKLGYQIDLFTKISPFFILFCTVSSCISFATQFLFYFKISYTFLGLSLISAIIIAGQLIKKEKLIFLIVILVYLIIIWVEFVILLNKFGFLKTFSTFSLFGICMSLNAAIYLLCQTLEESKSK